MAEGMIHFTCNNYENNKNLKRNKFTSYRLNSTFNAAIYELTGPELIKKVSDGYIINPEVLEL